MPVDATGERPHRVWVTDLHSGRTEAAAGPPYGPVVGDSFYPAGGDFGVRIGIFGPGRPGQLPKSDDQLATDVHFYAWASVIEDGRVVATDYAPDAGWLDPSILGVGRNEASPFGGINTVCVVPPQPGCRETDRDGFGITFTLPDGWTWDTSDHIDDRNKHVEARDGLIKKATGRSGPQGMSLQFLRGGWLFSDPCRKAKARPDIRVGPTANDFANALADHPLLDVTTPVPVTLGGHQREVPRPSGAVEHRRLHCRLPALGTDLPRPGPEPSMAHLEPRCGWRSRRGAERGLRGDVASGPRRDARGHRVHPDRILRSPPPAGFHSPIAHQRRSAPSCRRSSTRSRSSPDRHRASTVVHRRGRSPSPHKSNACAAMPILERF